MNCRANRFVRIGVAFFAASVIASNAVAAGKIILGDYDKEPRIGDHVNVKFLAKRLEQLHANTYMFLIGHSKNDWSDFIDFLPLAKKGHITVWAYLLPPSETPSQDSKFRYSEPYRLDYTKWSTAIAKLSLKFSNLKGYIIDDFWRNVTPTEGVHSIRLTKEDIRVMIDSAKKINPQIKFYPLMYFTHQMDSQAFAKTWAPMIDGVVAAYPENANQVERTLDAMNHNAGKRLPMIVMVSGDESTLTKFNHIDGTPQNIANGLNSMIGIANDGSIQGVVTYCLNLNYDSAAYSYVQSIFDRQSKGVGSD